jgi:hypothetical protein
MPPKKSKNAVIPLILDATLVFSGAQIQMYGEEHLNIDNEFYESLLSHTNADTVILVEHSTNSCHVSANTEHLFQAHAKGSEWVFYTQKKAGNPNVVCFDTRAEHGYLNAFEELEMAQVAERLHLGVPADIRFFIDNCMRTMSVFAHHHAWFENVLPGYFDRSYAMLNSQLQVVMALLKWRKAHPGANGKVLPGVAGVLAANLKRVASVSVDINLIRLIEELSAMGFKNILVFAGKNHVVRMSQMLQFKPRTKKVSVKINAEMTEQATTEMDGDMNTDRQIINSLNK